MRARNDRNRGDVRERLLHAMGIEVWYARGRAPIPGVVESGDPAEATVTDVVEPDAVSADADGPGSIPPVSVAVGRSASSRAPRRTVEPEQAPEPEPLASEAPGEAPFSIVALGAPGVLLLVDALQRSGEARLARDVVRAVRRDWSAPVEQAQFAWPQPGASGASAPAVTAFVEKQAEDHAARLLLASESVAARLRDAPFEFVAVPDLASLAEPRNKLALWRRIQELAP